LTNETSKNIVLAAASGYQFAQIKPFIVTLKKSGFKGDLCLFISQADTDLLNNVKQLDVKLIPFTTEYPFNEDLLDSNELLPDQFSNGVSVKFLRYILYYLFLKKYGDDYSNVLISDIKDVIFQRDPFEFQIGDHLCCFLEEAGYTLVTSPFNSGRILTHFGKEVLDEIGNNQPSCSGTIIGSIPAMIAYLEQMINVISTLDCQGGGDQGVHNYLIYTKKVPNLRLISNETGPVLTIGSKIGRQIRFNKYGLVINDKGEIYNIIHQYDRYPELFQGFFKRYGLELPISFLMKVLFMYKNRISAIFGRDILNYIVWKLVNLLKIKSR
jgi:hypothetical protein